MIRRLTPADRAALDAFLAAHADASMFLRSNLLRAGLVDDGRPYSGTWIGRFEDDLCGVVCHAWNGMMIVQAPDGVAPLVRAALAASGRARTGASGPADQVATARPLLGLGTLAVDSEEVLYAVDVAEVPAPTPEVRRAVPADRAQLVAWRIAYEMEIMGVTREQSAARAGGRIDDALGRGHLFLRLDDGAPVAMSAFNATLPDMVQIGGVYTPPEHRSRGHARAVVAGSLQIAAAGGVRRSVLFTPVENTAARRAYEAIGYRAVGRYGILFTG